MTRLCPSPARRLAAAAARRLTAAAAIALVLTPTLWAPTGARAATTGATTAEKVAAITTLELEPESTLLGLADCDLVIALWQRLEGKPYRDEVRAAAVSAFSAEAALRGDATTCTDFLRTGVFAAKDRDVAIQRRAVEEQQNELQLKQQAAQIIGLVLDQSLLALTVREFIWVIHTKATGENVREAALKAYQGSDADRSEFLSTGIATAHDVDRQRQIEEEAAGDAARRQQLLENEARTRALAILLVTPTAAMLASTDRDFITYIWENSKAGSEVRAAAERAILSRDPADWNAFIHTGIRAAYDEDVAIALRKKHEADVAQAEAIVAQAQKDGYLNLVAAAQQAIAASPTALDTFLRVGQYQLELRTSFQSGDVQPNWRDTTSPDGGVLNIGGYCCNLTGPELSTRDEGGHTGNTALMYSGNDKDAKKSYAYLRVFKLTRVVVQSTTALTYWVFPQSVSNSTCVAVDLVFSDGKTLRDSGATDTAGNRAHPANQCGKLTIGTWNKVVVPLGSRFAGKTVTSVNVGYDQPANTGGYRGYIDDISIAAA